MSEAPERPVYLAPSDRRIWDSACLRAIGKEAWLDIEVSGMLLRLVLTSTELNEMIAIFEQVRAQLETNGRPAP